MVFVTLGVVALAALAAHEIHDVSQALQDVAVLFAQGVGTVREFFTPAPAPWW